jgi:hypothetical protein
MGILFMVIVGAGAVAILNMRGSHHGCGSNETAAIATLRNLASAQAQFRAAGHADVDGDGIGEFGTFGEMTGADGIRADATGARRNAGLKITVLSAALAAVNENGIVTKSGYAFRIFLPGTGGNAVREGQASHRMPSGPGAGPPFSGPVDVDASETRWCAYAWPVSHGNSGTRAFFVDQGGDVRQMANKEGRYGGLIAGPEWNVAMPVTEMPGWAAPHVKEYRGRDGNLWKATN